MDGSIAFIGFGEAATTFARAAHWVGRARAFDIAGARKSAMQSAGVRHCATAAEALEGAEIVLSLVTADAAEAAAEDYAPSVEPGALWFDMNSVEPGTKRRAAEAIGRAGGRYVDAAIMAPVSPTQLRTPLLVAGADADEAVAVLRSLGFWEVRAVGDEIGRASAIKMIRSVMVKGIEALTDEMMQAAEAAGVADEVLASLDASERRAAWAQRAAYNIERMETHGVRRASEMEEVARMLGALGVEPEMTRGTIERQRKAAGRSQASRKERAA